MKYFTLDEFIISETAQRLGIPNIPTEEVVANIYTLSRQILDLLREKLKKPIIITSGYRCKELNEKVGGSSTSQHRDGKAADIKVKGMTAADLFNYISNSKLPYDQLILEYDSWVHISYDPDKTQQRFERRKIFNENGVKHNVKL